MNHTLIAIQALLLPVFVPAVVIAAAAYVVARIVQVREDIYS